MNLRDIILVLERKLQNLHVLMRLAQSTGDLQTITKLQIEIIETEESISTIKSTM